MKRLKTPLKFALLMLPVALAVATLVPFGAGRAAACSLFSAVAGCLLAGKLI